MTFDHHRKRDGEVKVIKDIYGTKFPYAGFYFSNSDFFVFFLCLFSNERVIIVVRRLEINCVINSIF